MLVLEYDHDKALAMERKEGRYEGLEEGRAEGLKEGKHLNAVATARRLMSLGLSLKDIAMSVGLSLEEIQGLV